MKSDRVESQKLATFLEIGQTLAGTYGLKSAMSRVLDTLGAHQGMIRSVVMLLDSDTDDLRIVASFGLDESGARKIKYRIGEWLTGSLGQTGKAITVPQ